jgi:hypothetical protein
MWKEAVIAQFVVLSWHLSQVTEENNENPNKGNRYLVWDAIVCENHSPGKRVSCKIVQYVEILGFQTLSIVRIFPIHHRQNPIVRVKYVSRAKWMFTF